MSHPSYSSSSKSLKQVIKEARDLLADLDKRKDVFVDPSEPLVSSSHPLDPRLARYRERNPYKQVGSTSMKQSESSSVYSPSSVKMLGTPQEPTPMSQAEILNFSDSERRPQQRPSAVNRFGQLNNPTSRALDFDEIKPQIRPSASKAFSELEHPIKQTFSSKGRPNNPPQPSEDDLDFWVAKRLSALGERELPQHPMKPRGRSASPSIPVRGLDDHIKRQELARARSASANRGPSSASLGMTNPYAINEASVRAAQRSRSSDAMKREVDSRQPTIMEKQMRDAIAQRQQVALDRELKENAGTILHPYKDQIAQMQASRERAQGIGASSGTVDLAYRPEIGEYERRQAAIQRAQRAKEDELLAEQHPIIQKGLRDQRNFQDQVSMNQYLEEQRSHRPTLNQQQMAQQGHAQQDRAMGIGGSYGGMVHDSEMQHPFVAPQIREEAVRRDELARQQEIQERMSHHLTRAQQGLAARSQSSQDRLTGPSVAANPEFSGSFLTREQQLQAAQGRNFQDLGMGPSIAARPEMDYSRFYGGYSYR